MKIFFPKEKINTRLNQKGIALILVLVVIVTLSVGIAQVQFQQALADTFAEAQLPWDAGPESLQSPLPPAAFHLLYQSPKSRPESTNAATATT